MIDNVKILRQTQEAINKAVEDARKRRNEEDRRYIVASIGNDLARILTPLLQQIAENAKLSREDIKAIIREIKVEAPQVNVEAPKVNVQTPEAKVKVEIPNIKIPRIIVPTPQVTVKPAEVKMPKEIEIKNMDKIAKAIADALSKKQDINLGVNRDKPLNVILTDEKGKEYRALTSILTGGGPGVVTTRRIDDIPVGFEQLAVGNAAVGLADIPDKANKAIMTIEDSTIRYREDGTAPDANTGLRVFIGGVIILNSRQSLTTFRAIRVAAPNSELNVAYYESK